jgi:hypothetical protein
MIDSEDKRPEPESLSAIAKKGVTARDIAGFLFTGKREQPIPKKKISSVSLLIYVLTHLRQIKDNTRIGRAPYVKKSVLN